MECHGGVDAGERPDGRGARGGPRKRSRDEEKDRAFIRRVFPQERQERALREWHFGVTKQIALVLAAHGHRRLDGLPASVRTHAARAEVLFLAFRQLREVLGFRLRTVRRFEAYHWRALVRYWLRDGIASSTMNMRLSALRIFAAWLGKPGLVPEATELERLGFASGTARRRSYAVADRSWSGKIDLEAKFHQAEAIDLRSGLILRLEHAFGLRRKEAVRYHPHRGDRGDAILVLGAKGGQLRWVPIRTPEQRALMDRCKALIPQGDAMGGKALGLVAGYKKVGRVVELIGATKKGLGVTQHGLRQEYINDRIEEETGAVASVKDPTSKLPRDPESMSRRRGVMREVGHRRADAVRGYYGKANPDRGTNTEEGGDENA